MQIMQINIECRRGEVPTPSSVGLERGQPAPSILPLFSLSGFFPSNSVDRGKMFMRRATLS